MASHSSILAWKISWTEEPGRATVHGVAKSWTWLSTHTHIHTHAHTYNCNVCNKRYMISSLVIFLQSQSQHAWEININTKTF